MKINIKQDIEEIIRIANYHHINSKLYHLKKILGIGEDVNIYFYQNKDGHLAPKILSFINNNTIIQFPLFLLVDNNIIDVNTFKIDFQNSNNPKLSRYDSKILDYTIILKTNTNRSKSDFNIIN